MNMRQKIWNLIRGGSFHGYLSTESGYPLTLSGCMPEYPISLSVAGNTVQDGTPAPDNPAEVQGCGDRTANLFNGLLAFGSTTKGNINGVGYRALLAYPLYVNAGTYTASFDSDINIALSLYGTYTKSGNTITYADMIKISPWSTEKQQSITVTTPGYLSIGIKFASVTVMNANNTKDIKIMLNEGGTALPYEPHGYKLPVTASGRNVFSGFVYNKKSISASTGMLVNTTSEVIYSDFIKIERDKKYYWKLPDGLTTSNFTSGILHAYTDADETTWCGRSTNNDMTNYGVGSHIVELSSRITTNIPSDAGEINYVRFNFVCASADIKTQMLNGQSYLNDGSEFIDEPYHTPQTIPIYMDSPLYSNDNVADTVELDVGNKKAICTKRTSVDDNGNVTQLAAPVTTDISDMQDWDSIPKLWRGTAIFTADTTIQPSDITVKYYADKPEEVS